MEKRENIFLKKSFVAITGASRGFGRCMALKFAVKFPPNSVLVLMARNEEALECIRTELQATAPNITVLVRQYDQGKSDEGYFNGIFDSLLTESKCSKDDFEQVMLVHNCATTGDKDKTAIQLCDTDRVRSYYNMNLCGMILLNTSFFATFCDPSPSRVVVNVTSGGSQRPIPSLHLYCAGKAARDMFFRVLCAEEPSIRVLTYSPGGVDTDMFRDIETNSSSSSLRKVTNGMREDGKLLTPEESVADLEQVLEENAFDNAEFVDYFLRKFKPYADKYKQ
ncbi:sepiapterin reductase-like [Pecten maximus]|uniref:sepiapterin reductase-like n=1 Tax=Pecten maximus TaxID=6579 RepID=UPI001458B7CF|nr:sepiapterin reductase-like [Pecten maximus]XP_033762179.1 sepiapterin reductase-like [Pecten maximus]